MSRDLKALIIEKDIRISPRIGEALERKGFAVLTSDDGLEGLETAKKEKPDLVILDFFLPNLDGYWVSAFIKRNKTLQKTKVLAFSSRTTPRMHRILEEASISSSRWTTGRKPPGGTRRSWKNSKCFSLR